MVDRRWPGHGRGGPARGQEEAGRRASTVGSAYSPAHDGDDADDANDGASRYEAPAARDAEWARRVAWRLSAVVLDR